MIILAKVNYGLQIADIEAYNKEAEHYNSSIEKKLSVFTCILGLFTSVSFIGLLYLTYRFCQNVVYPYLVDSANSNRTDTLLAPGFYTIVSFCFLFYGICKISGLLSKLIKKIISRNIGEKRELKELDERQILFQWLESNIDSIVEPFITGLGRLAFNCADKKGNVRKISFSNIPARVNLHASEITVDIDNMTSLFPYKQRGQLKLQEDNADDIRMDMH